VRFGLPVPRNFPQAEFFMHDDGDTSGGPKLVSNRAMDIAVALIFLAIALVVIADSVRLGFGWQEGVGPAAGYFPFLVALIMGAASLVNLVRAIFDRQGAAEVFVTRAAFWRVLAVLVPLVVFVFAIAFVGIYVAAAVFIALFMIYFGGYFVLALPVGVGVAVGLFALFEKWFLVPLPKGPLEAWLGY
jgi:hypothetical protein